MYYESLETASVEQNVEHFIDIISECVEDSLMKYLHAIR